MMVSIYNIVERSSIFGHPKLIGDISQYDDDELINAIKGSLNRTKDYLDVEIKRIEKYRSRRNCLEITSTLNEIYAYFTNYREIVGRLLDIDDVQKYLDALKEPRNKPFSRWNDD